MSQGIWRRRSAAPCRGGCGRRAGPQGVRGRRRRGGSSEPAEQPSARRRSGRSGAPVLRSGNRRAWTCMLVRHVPPITVHIGGSEYPEQGVPSSTDLSQALVRSTDNTVAAFLTFLAEEQVSVRTARLYLGHLGRFAA